VAIVIVLPGFGDPSGFLDALKPTLAEAFIRKPPLETIADAVLQGIARLDELVPGPR
jgi:hypothetical protein